MKKKFVFLILLFLPYVVYGMNNMYASEEIEYMATKDHTNFATDDPDGNVRYIGSNPNNYISFNGELWRIIGVMDGIEDSNGNVDKRIKIIRDEIILNTNWDSSEHSINDGQGINEWSTSNINKILNEDGYINRNSVTCEVGINNTLGTCDFTNTGLTEESKKIIDSVVWDLGSNWDDNYRVANAATFYQYPKSGKGGNLCTTGLYCTDTVERTLSFTGLVGLVYPADYIYATAGNDSTSRDTCLNGTVIKDWDDNNPDCYNTNWMTTSDIFWALNPYTDTTYNTTAFYIRNKVGMRAGFYNYGVRPVVYLTKHLVIKTGDGSKENPYVVVPGRKVQFNSNGGSVVNAQVDELNALVLGASVEKAGYEFLGWYVDEDLTIPFDFSTNVAEDMTLYAKWKEVKNPNTRDQVVLISITMLFAGVGVYYTFKKFKEIMI